MKVDRNIVSQPNKDAILDVIRRDPEGVSRAEIAKRLNISRSTVSTIVDDLISSGLVLERGAGVSRGGRRPIVLGVNPDGGRVVGVDMGATHLLVVVADLCGRKLFETEAPWNIASGPQKCLKQMRGLVGLALDNAQCGLADVGAIAVGVPGPVVAAQGIVSSPPIMPGWDGFPIRGQLREHWLLPVVVENDANLGALGEWVFGAGRGESDLAYIKIGTGIGCGLLLGGKVYHGILGTAGEIGHVTVSPDGQPCKCGNYGCLEAMAGGRAIAQRAQMAVEARQPTVLADLPADREITAHDVALAAQAGDVISQQLLSDAGRHIGSTLASLINLLNPGLVLVGGGVAESGDLLFAAIQDAIRQRGLRASLQATRIARAALGRYSVSMGAVALALDVAFQAYTRARAGRLRQPA
jgi:glucokinase-like ROK family protein